MRICARLLLLLCLSTAFAPGWASNPTVKPAWQVELGAHNANAKIPVPRDAFALPSKAFTLAVKIRRAESLSPGPILTLKDSKGQAPIVLYVGPLGSGSEGTEEKTIAFSVRTDFKPQPLNVGLPVRLLNTEPGKEAEHELILRYEGFRVDLFVDGVLADQDWPIGVLAPNGIEVLQASSNVSALQVWPRTLDDATIAAISGGAAAIERRTDAMFGPEPTEMQYARPRGYNTSAGDAMPFFHNGTLHVFFLLDRRHHHSKWGLGAHQWGHVSTTDLVHWKHYPPALVISHEWEASMCTGSIFFHAGKYYAFYATRMPDRSERLGMAKSNDGVTFEKEIPTPFAEVRPPYKHGPNRDPFVFEKDGEFHMLVTASLLHPAGPDDAGALEELVSKDLQHWEVLPKPFLVTGYKADPECSDLFFWKGWYYLFFGEDGATHYRMSHNWNGPWLKPENDILDNQQARVMKTAEFPGDRRIAVGFIPQGNWGGNLVFRELHQGADGTLETSFPPEMTPHGKLLTKWKLLRESGDTHIADQKVVLQGATASASAVLDGLPQNFYLKAKLSAEGSGTFGFSISGKNEGTQQVFHFEIHPADRSIRWDGPEMAQIHWAPALGTPVEVEVVAKGTIIDTALNGTHTFIHRLPDLQQRSISLIASGSTVSVTDIVVRSVQ